MSDETPRRAEPASDAKKHANKLVVLSSVAKPPLNEEDSLLGAPTASKSESDPPPKAGEEGLIRPVGWTTRPGGATTIIKLPPKTGVLPRLTSLAPKKDEPPPELPQKSTSDLLEANKRSAPIKLNALATPAVPGPDSIFGAPGSVPVEAKPPIARRATPPPLPSSVEKKAPAVPAPIEKKTTKVTPPAPVATKTPPPIISKPATVEPHHLTHVPPLVPHDAPAPESDLDQPNVKPPASATAKLDAPPPKIDPLAQTARLSPPVLQRSSSVPPTQNLLPLPDAGKTAELLKAEYRSPENEAKKHRLPPRATTTTSRLPKPVEPAQAPEAALKASATTTPPKVYPITPPSGPIKGAPVPAVTKPVDGSIAPPASVKSQAVKSSVTPPTIPLHPGKGYVKPPTIPLKPAPVPIFSSPIMTGKSAEPEIEGDEEAIIVPKPSSRAARMRKRRLILAIVFYVLFAAFIPCLYFLSLHFTQETRIEGQVIPPSGMLLDKEVWIVTDFRDLAKGVTDDLTTERMSVLQEMQEKLGHVQRAQADVATREARIRVFKDQIRSDNDEEMSLVKQARDASQQIWDGPGATLESDYQSRLMALNQAISDRAKANHLAYNPDPNFFSPEVWANAYRLALYEVPQGVDAIKERQWLDAQMKAWHDFTKAMDQKQNDLRDQATQLRLAPASRIADLKAQIDDLQQRIDGTIAEEEPLKAELEQAQTDLSAVQAKEAGLDAPAFAELDALPVPNIIKRLPLAPNGRFSWRDVQKESTYGSDEKDHVLWIFARALRSDGRQYWALHRFDAYKDKTMLVTIDPDSFISTRAILRPDLSPDEQAQ